MGPSELVDESEPNRGRSFSVDLTAVIDGVTAPYPMGYALGICEGSNEKSPASPPGTLAVSATLVTLPTDGSCYATDHRGPPRGWENE